MSEELSKILDELAARFGSTGVALWESMVRYEIATAWYGLGFCLVLLFVGVLGTVVVYDGSSDEALAGFVTVLVISVFITAIVCSYAIPTLVAPEAAVIRGLLS